MQQTNQKSLHLSASMKANAATAQEIIDSLPRLAAQANRGCGQVYEVYVDRLSGMVDQAIEHLDPAAQALVRSVATATVSYLTPAELETMHAEMEDEGLCQHGLDEMTCPCGCFEFERDYDDSPDDDLPRLEFRYLEVIRDLSMRAHADTLRMVMPIYKDLAPYCEQADVAYVDALVELEGLEHYLR